MLSIKSINGDFRRNRRIDPVFITVQIIQQNIYNENISAAVPIIMQYLFKLLKIHVPDTYAEEKRKFCEGNSGCAGGGWE